MCRRKLLKQTLTTLFPDIWELSVLLRDLPDGSALAALLPDPQVGSRRYLSAVTDQLIAKGFVDHAFFQHLIRSFPRSAPQGPARGGPSD